MRKVAVMTTFGSNDPVRQRSSILEFMRLKYLVEEKINVPARNTDRSIDYKLEAHKVEVGQIAAAVLELIAEADILVAFITEKNANVIYELAVRNLLRDELILIVKGEPKDLLPIYVGDWAHIPSITASSDNDPVATKIKHMADEEEPRLNWKQEIPSELKQVIDKHDERYAYSLGEAFHTIEHNCPKRPKHILELAKYLDPGGFLESWITYYPCSVVRIKWHGMSDSTSYTPEDMDGKPVVYYGNYEFKKLFGLGVSNLPDPDGIHPLALGDLIRKIKKKRTVEGCDLQDFLDDQTRLQETIILQQDFATAKVPLRFNGNHAQESIRNQAFLPCLIGKRTVGEKTRPHTTYLLIAYINLDAVAGAIQLAAVA